MLCEFCRHEFDDSLTECPYCHKKVDIEAPLKWKVLPARTATQSVPNTRRRTVIPGRKTLFTGPTVHTKITGILQALRCTGREEVC